MEAAEEVPTNVARKDMNAAYDAEASLLRPTVVNTIANKVGFENVGSGRPDRAAEREERGELVNVALVDKDHPDHPFRPTVAKVLQKTVADMEAAEEVPTNVARKDVNAAYDAEASLLRPTVVNTIANKVGFENVGSGRPDRAAEREERGELVNVALVD